MSGTNNFENDSNTPKYPNEEIDLVRYYELLRQNEPSRERCDYWEKLEAYCEFKLGQAFLQLCEDYLIYNTTDLAGFRGNMVRFEITLVDNINQFELCLSHNQPKKMIFNRIALDFSQVTQYVRDQFEELTNIDPINENEFKLDLQANYW